jgi:hypothetical protein
MRITSIKAQLWPPQPAAENFKAPAAKCLRGWNRNAAYEPEELADFLKYCPASLSGN